MTLPLFPRPNDSLADGATVLRGFALASADAFLDAIAAVAMAAPFRQRKTPNGLSMSVAMTSCGPFGWVSDRAGYRYAPLDPANGNPWPAMPDVLRTLARTAAAAGGFAGFEPDACLVNRYVPGARMGLHQDRDEKDFTQPIVSVSLGLPATFLFGGETRRIRPRRIVLEHGDVVVFGGPARLRFHGVAPLAEGTHPATGAVRYNLTFRRAQA